MPFIPTPIEGLLLFEPRILRDERGYFYESFNTQTFAQEGGITVPFVQDNQARSTYGIVRGLHYQTGEYAQAKLVRVVQGIVLDVAVDLRPNSLTYGQTYSVVLSDENHRQLYVPRGFAHGYAVLSPTAIFVYKCDNYYNKLAEGGVVWNCSALGIDWQIPHHQVVVSEKDGLLPTFGKHIPAL
jgi:dTDP-4-dehydrorhamnose 3,5-epimerase